MTTTDYLNYIQDKLQNSFDIKHKQVVVSGATMHLFFADTMANLGAISEYIVFPLLAMSRAPLSVDEVKGQVLFAGVVGDVQSPEDAVMHILSGNVVLLFDGFAEALFCDTRKIATRAVETSTNEPVIRGSKESFNEELMDNVSLLRKRIKTPDFVLEVFQVGKQSNTPVVLAYIKGLAPPRLIATMRKKLTAMEIEYLTDPSFIEEQIKHKWTMFDTVGFTERPDSVTAKLFEGKIVILVEGSSSAITAPYFFVEHFHAPDDYYLNKYMVNFHRLLRFFAYLVAVLLPGFYIALVTYHHSLIPIRFVIRMSSSRVGVPFPTVMELLLMMAFFEFSREAGKRLPPTIGQPLSIVSALILGEAAIGAGLTSEITIVITGIFATASYLNPKLNGSVTIGAVIFIFSSTILGLHGFWICAVLLIAHLGSLSSCGYPYLYPIGTVKKLNLSSQDVVLRGDLRHISYRLLR
ncbi:spore germination protein [Heliobacterium gestii]|uniref:Spore germination protein n=1 Tax=Heliomicrobium gestii TaxID=2699 RepID=A0A845L5X4_HELGE|nr:spore germination protein [Heliomicrobium gestii]MBM7865776.1 hypothetical protein [Heliomicrobium gestii]MZP42022.1 spore germination protein [Heliomicrobium gestii]